MKKPNLDNMWETFVLIPFRITTSNLPKLYDILRFDVSTMINSLKERNLIDWYSFLIHSKKSGGLCEEADQDLFIHIRLSFKESLNRNVIESFIPDYCTIPIDNTKIRKCKDRLISGIDEGVIENNEIEQAWKILGEASEWILQMLNIHKKDREVPIPQVSQFLHFISNMTCLRVS